MPSVRIPAIIFFVFLLLGAFVLLPQMDLTVSGWFYDSSEHFYLSKDTFFLFMEKIAFYLPRILGIVFLILIAFTIMARRTVFGIDTKGWAFLFLALVLGPGLVANGIFKDHWGRARPREIIEFGGTHQFSPALVPQQIQHRNGSFVSGDASFGFFLPSIAYIVPRSPRRHLSRRFFWGSMGLGSVFGFSRLVMGAHFLSDILFAMVFMLAVSAMVYALMFGRKATAAAWRDWMFHKDSEIAAR